MSRAGVRRSLVTVVVVASLVSCMKGDQPNLVDQQKQGVQQNLADEQAFIADLAPDADTVHINFTCATVDSIGLTANGKSAWNVMRRRNNSITWVVAPTVTINSIKGKSSPLPIDTTQGEPHGGTPGTSFKGKVSNNAGVPGPNPDPGNPKDRGYAYELDVTCTAGPNSTRLVIDPELIVRRP